jgi:hypothetical protein
MSMPQTIPRSPPPPPPSAPPGPSRAIPDRGALLDEISGGTINLKPVCKQEDETNDAYQETFQCSRNDEDRERGQASLRAWSEAGEEDEENESERRRALKEILEAHMAEGLSGKIGRVLPGKNLRLSGEG